MSVSSLDHQQIVGVVKRVGEGLLLLEHLYPVDTCDAQCFGAAVQLAGVLAVMMMQFGVTRIRIGIPVQSIQAVELVADGGMRNVQSGLEPAMWQGERAEPAGGGAEDR